MLCLQSLAVRHSPGTLLGISMAQKGIKRAATMNLDDAAQLRRQAEEIETTNRLSVISAVLRETPLYISVVESALRQAGADLSKVNLEAEPVPAKKSKAAAANARSELLPKCEVYFGMLSGPTLQALLCDLEACYTPESLSSLKPSPRKAIPKLALQALMEFLTGMRADTWIGSTGKLKEYEYLSQTLKKLNTMRGRRGRDVRLPPVWGTDGVYAIVGSSGECVMLRHKFLGEEKKPLRALPADLFKMIRDQKGLMIEKNWSEVDALLVEVKGKLRYRISLLYVEEVEENILPSVGEFPENPGENVARPASLEAGMLKMLETDSFTRYRGPRTNSSETLGGESAASQGWPCSPSNASGSSPPPPSATLMQVMQSRSDGQPAAMGGSCWSLGAVGSQAQGPLREKAAEDDQEENLCTPPSKKAIVDESEWDLQGVKELPPK